MLQHRSGKAQRNSASRGTATLFLSAPRSRVVQNQAIADIYATRSAAQTGTATSAVACGRRAHASVRLSPRVEEPGQDRAVRASSAIQPARRTNIR